MGEVTPPSNRRGPALTGPSALTSIHDTSRFSSDHNSLNDWLKNTALKSEERTARTYVVCEENNVVVGYYCLSTGSVAHAGAPRRVKQNSPDPVPVMIIGRLAVAKPFERQGIGSGMLQDAFRRILQASKIVGCRAVLVHAIDQQALEFYAKYSFKEFPPGTRTLFLPLETLQAAL